MIFSNVDAAYMDCGFGAWVGEGNNWCSPYKGWQLQYENDLYGILEDKQVNIYNSSPVGMPIMLSFFVGE